MGLLNFISDEQARKDMARNAMNIAQSASNAAAGNVTGLVDLSAMALRALGVPVPADAFLSSEWAKKKGFTRDVPHDAPSLAGETLGLLAPVAVSAKAPQIARGLLQGVENMSAPSVLNKQSGVLYAGGIDDAERAARMEAMGMERGYWRGGEAPNNAGNRTGPWYTKDKETAEGYAKGRGGDVREYALPKTGYLDAAKNYNHNLPNDVAKIISDPYYGKKGQFLAKEFSSYGPGEGISGGQLWASLKMTFGDQDAMEIISKLGKFNGAKNITHNPADVVVFKNAPVRDANQAKFNLADYGKDDIYGKVSLPMLGAAAGTALGAGLLLRRD